MRAGDSLLITALFAWIRLLGNLLPFTDNRKRSIANQLPGLFFTDYGCSGAAARFELGRPVFEVVRVGGEYGDPAAL